MIAISIAITMSSLFISMAAIYAVYTWAEIKTKQNELDEKRFYSWKPEVVLHKEEPKSDND